MNVNAITSMLNISDRILNAPELDSSILFWTIETTRPHHIWSHAKPFAANSNEIVLSECLECGRCGLRNTKVNIAGNFVIWSRNYECVDYELKEGEYIAFLKSEYCKAIGDYNIEGLEALDNGILYKNMLTQYSLHGHVSGYIDSNTSNLSDNHFCEMLSKAIESLATSVEFHSNVSSSCDVKIYYDNPKSTIQNLRIGVYNERYWLLFERSPSFPLWITNTFICDNKAIRECYRDCMQS